MYKPKRVEGGWQLFWVEGSTSRPVDGEYIYTHRQNAYARAKALNDRMDGTVPQRIVTVEVTCEKTDISRVMDAVTAIFGLIPFQMLVLDKAWQPTTPEEHRNRRVVMFSYSLFSLNRLRPTAKHRETTEEQLAEMLNKLINASGVIFVEHRFDGLRIA